MTTVGAPSSHAVVIVICGNAGTGKSTFARRLAASYGAMLIDIDANVGAVVRAGVKASGLDENDRDSPEYKRLFRDAIHDSLFDAAVEQINATGSRLPIILIAPFTKERRLPTFHRWLLEKLTRQEKMKDDRRSSQHNALHVIPVLLHCATDERARRIRERNFARDDLKFVRQPDGTRGDFIVEGFGGGSCGWDANDATDPLVTVIDVTAAQPHVDVGPWADALKSFR